MGTPLAAAVPMRPVSHAFLLACLPLLASACLSNAHRIPKSDLARLAEQEPGTRGQRVRVIQTFSATEQPPQSEQPVEVCDTNTAGSVHVNVGSSSGPRGNRASSRGPRPSKGSAGGSGGHSSPKGGHHGSKSGSKSSSGGGGPSLSGIDGDAAAVLAVVLVASAAAIAVVAAGSEGARYDGWARLEEEHPIHLYGPRNHYKEVPLKDLTIEDAEWAERAYVRKSEGPWHALQRAPLNRKGWAYSVFLGAGELGDDGSTPSLGPSSHIQLGYFPIHEFGLHADVGFGWGEASDPMDTSSRFAASAGLEAQLLPFQSQRIHAGGFAQAGRSVRTRSAGGGRSALYSTGALMQLDITTRLAVTARAGVTRAHGESASEMSVGLSIY